MSSDPGSKAEEIPPVLPVKQHRSHSSRCSSEEFDCAMLYPVGLQHQNDTSNDVFPEPTDCQAAQCPTHQHYDPSQHQVRCFSDGTPPPVPKKRLARTLSLPGTNAPPPSPLSPLYPLQGQPRNFDNPSYMLAPIADQYFHEAKEEFKPLRGSPVTLLSFSQLSFDTPDERLPYFFGSFDEQRVVLQRLQHRHLLFLRSMAQSVASGILLQEEAAEKDVSSYLPQDFRLCEGSKPKWIGDAVYYSLHSRKFPGRILGLRVHKQNDETPSAHTKQKSSHVNVQDVVAHFQPSNTSRNDSFILQTQDPCALKPGCSTAKPSGGGSTEYPTGHTNINLTSLQSLLMNGHSLSVERDLPDVTLEDFAQSSSSLQSTDCLNYDRQVCVLLLQILMGSQHLYKISASAAELKPREIFLVWSNREKEETGNEPEHDASEMKTSRLKDDVEWEMAEGKGKIQMLWRAHGSPRVVLTPLSSALSVPHPLIYIKSQIGALIQYCLHSHESLTRFGSGPTLSKSSYRRGLLYLASLLHSESSEPQMAGMVAMLQVLLWGPHFPLSDHRCPTTTIVDNWLTIKRALLVMKLAESGLVQDQSALDWEDWMCLQYLSFADPEAILSIISQLWLTLNAD